MNTSRPFHFHSSCGRGLQLLGGPLRQGAQDAGGEAAPGVAVAGRVGRAGLQAAGGAVGDDARHGVAAAVVVAEDLGEEAPEGRDRAEHPVAVLDAVLVEGVADAGLGQDVGEREALVAREAGAEPIQARHGIGLGVSGRDDRDDVGGEGLVVIIPYPTSAHGLMFTARSRRRACERRGAAPSGAEGGARETIAHRRANHRGSHRVRTDPAERPDASHP